MFVWGTDVDANKNGTQVHRPPQQSQSHPAALPRTVRNTTRIIITAHLKQDLSSNNTPFELRQAIIRGKLDSVNKVTCCVCGT